VLIFLLANLVVDILYGVWIRGSPMTDLRGQPDVSRTPLFRCKSTPPVGPEEVISRRGHWRPVVARWERMRGATCAAVRCFGSLWL
jgi:hypothetical protein